MQNNLIGYSAFWHSDKSWGFGATMFRADNPHLFDTFYEQVEKLGENLHTDSTMTVEEATVQLRQFIREYQQIRPDVFNEHKLALLILMFGNVKFLTLKGAIANDEYNGLQYAYAL